MLSYSILCNEEGPTKSFTGHMAFGLKPSLFPVSSTDARFQLFVSLHAKSTGQIWTITGFRLKDHAGV